MEDVSRGGGGLDASFGATRAVAAQIEVQQLKASVRARLFGTDVDAPRLGEFTIRRRIGRGGMGAVYEAEDRRGEVVALKTLRGFSPAALYTLKHEFRALAGLLHPNLVHLHRLVVDGEQVYFTMELVDGVDFVRHVRGDLPARAPLGDDALARLRDALGQLVAGIAALHGAGKLHRDVKPSNVLVTGAGRVVLLDFGLVREISEISTISSSNDVFVGTPAYMAPETASGEPVGEAGDWYSLGVVLFEALCGELPFAGSGFQVLVDKCNLPSPRPVERTPGVPADLDALCARLLARDPAARPGLAELQRALAVPVAPAPSPSPAPAVGGLCGREALLGRVRAALGAARERGEPALLCLRGEPGIGKSALLHALVDERQRGGAVVLSGRCHTAEAVPFRALDPVIDALTSALLEVPPEALHGLLPADPRALVRLFPVLGRLPGVDVAAAWGCGDDDHAGVLRRAIDGLRGLLARLAARTPVLLAIDDLHWGDDDSIALLGALLAGPSPPPLAVVFTACAADPAGAALLRALTEAHRLGVEVVDVGPLSRGDAVAAARALVGEGAASSAVEAIAAEAGGSPLLIVELVRHVLEVRAPAGAVRLEDVIGRRLAALEAPARRLLDAVAVAAGPIDPEVAAATAGLRGDARGHLARLRAASLLRAGIVGGAEVLEVGHERIRQLVVDAVDPAACRALHGRLADEMAARGAPPERLARHLRAAGRRAEALEHTLAAGEEALAALALRRAVSFFLAALDLCEDEARRRDLHRRAAEALVLVGRALEAAEHYAAAAATAPADEAHRLRRAEALVLLRGGEFERGTAAMRAVMAEVGETWPEGHVRKIGSLALARARARLAWPRSALPAADARRRLEALSAARAGVSSADPIASALFQARYLRLSRELGDPDHLAAALAGEAAFEAYLGAGGRADRLLAEARAALAAAKDPRAAESLALCAGVVAHCQGEWARCVGELERIRGLGLVHEGSHYIATMGGFFELNALFFAGRWRELARRRAALVGWADEAGGRVAATTLRAGHQVFALLLDGRVDEAQAELDGAFRGWPAVAMISQRAWAFHGACAVDLYAGDPERAWARLAAAWPEHARHARLSGSYLWCMSRFWRGTIALRAAAGRGERLAIAAAMARGVAAAGVPWATGCARLLKGGVRRARGDDRGAAAAYASALHLFESSDMSMWAVAARWRLGEACGGAAGAALVAAAAARLRAEGAREPARLVEALAPGLG